MKARLAKVQSMVDKKSTPARRGRPRHAARPLEILEAGFKEFADKGFLATRLEDVAVRAGVAKGTVYLYYESKEALFEAAVRSRILPVVEHAEELVKAYEGSTVGLLHLLVTAMYGRISNPEVRTLMRIMIADGQRFPNLTAFYYRNVVAKMMALLETIVQRGVDRREFPPGAMTRLPAVLVAPGIMGAIWQMTFATEHDVPLERFLHAHLDLIARALTPEDRSL